MKIFITGGTGFIGKRVIRELAPHVNKIYLLVRKESFFKVEETFANIKNLQVIEGDILTNDVCSRVEDVAQLSKSVDHVLHLAAKYDLAMSALDAYTHNVIGVQNVLNLCRKLERLQYFHHVSTYAVNGASGGRIKESDFFIDAPFPDHYSRSKMQGEHLVRTMDIGKAKKRIYRPGIVVGDSQTGEIEKIDGPYYFFKFALEMTKYHHLVEKLGYLPLPFGSKTVFPVVPVDVLSRWMAQSVLHPKDKALIKSYHFIGAKQITLRNFLEKALPELGIHCSVARLKRNRLYKSLLPRIGMPEELMPYMFMEASYETVERRKDFPQHEEFSLEEIVPRLARASCRQLLKGAS